MATQAPKAEGMTREVPPARAVSESSSPRAAGKSKVIWQGETWDNCPFLCLWCAPLCCVAKKWYVTSDMIQQQHGCCGTKEDTMYVKRIKDISYETNCCCKVFCCGRGTVHIKSSDHTTPEVHMTMCGARSVYRKLRDAHNETATNLQVHEGQHDIY